MKLAKDCIDIGIYTNQKQEQLEFWQQSVGLPYEELLKTGGGNHQHRHSLNGSVFKLNHSRNPVRTGDPTGYDELYIATDDITDAKSLIDPDGNRVTLVPRGFRGITNIGIGMRVSNIAAFQRFYVEQLEIDQIDDQSFSWGSTVFLLTEDKNKAKTEGIAGQGFRYITVQIWDVDAEHQAFLDRGGEEASAPRSLGSTARISFIKDPDHNWIEISQRASLTGELPT